MSHEHPRANCDTIDAEKVRSLLRTVIEREGWGSLSGFQCGRKIAAAVQQKTNEVVSGKTVQRILEELTPTRDVLHANRVTLEKYLELNPGELLARHEGTELVAPNGSGPSAGVLVHPTDEVTTLSPYLEPAHYRFFGRTAELNLLNGAIEVGRPSIVVFTGGGGSGKTTILYQSRERWLGAGWRRSDSRRIASWFEWSFSSQADTRARDSSAGFLQKATEHFARRGHAVAQSDPSRWGGALAEAFRAIGGVMVLDGIEPLLNPHGERVVFRDTGLEAFLLKVRGFAPPTAVPRLLAVTSRYPIPGLSIDGADVAVRALKGLDPRDGADLLRQFSFPDGPGGLTCQRLADSPVELQAAFEAISREYGGHPLTLLLVASYLLRRGLDLDERPSNPPFDPTTHVEAHAARVIASYDRLFKEQADVSARACRQLLLQLGLFDPSASLDNLRALWSPPIPDVADLAGIEYEAAIGELVRLGLLTESRGPGPREVTAHPLVRAYYAERLGTESGEAARTAHARLFEQYMARPTAGDDLERLCDRLEAVKHGCRAGRFRDAFDVLKSGTLSAAQRASGGWLRVLTALAHFCPVRAGEFPDAAPDQFLTAEQKYFVLMQTAVGCTATKGIADSGAEVAYNAASDLATELSPQEKFCSGVGQWRVQLVRGRVRDAGDELVRLERTVLRDSVPPYWQETLRSLRVVTAFFAGRFADAERDLARPATVIPVAERREQLRQLMMLYDPEVTNRIFAGWVNWTRGRFGKALTECRAGVREAEELGDFVNAVIAQFFLVTTYQFFGDREKVLTESAVLKEKTNGLRNVFFLHGARFLHAWAHPVSHETVAAMREALDGWRGTNAGLVLPYFNCLLAEAHLTLDQPGEAARLVGEARDSAARGEGWWAAETERVDAAVHLYHGRAAEAERRFADAISEARAGHAGAAALELRASLHRVRAFPDRPDFREHLADVTARLGGERCAELTEAGHELARRT